MKITQDMLDAATKVLAGDDLDFTLMNILDLHTTHFKNNRSAEEWKDIRFSEYRELAEKMLIDALENTPNAT